MIIVLISNTVIVKNLSNFNTDKIRTELTFDNPSYLEMVKRGRFIPASTSRYIKLWRNVGPNICIPRGYLNRLIFLIKHEKHKIIDNTVCPLFNIKFTGKQRDYAEKAVKDLLKHRYGILEASTGSGKTVMAIDYIVKRKTTALIIAHSKELMEQWEERLKQFTDIKQFGHIGGGKYEVKEITIGIINSVRKKAKEIQNEFGVLILDEVHRAMGATWVYTLNTLRPKYQLGLSATPFRSDGLTKALYRLVGPKLHKVNVKVLENTGSVLKPKVCRVNTSFLYYFKNDYAKMVSVLVNNNERNDCITKAIAHDILKYNEPIMVVSDRVNHCEELLQILLSKHNSKIKPVVVHGRQKQSLRSLNINKIKRRLS